MKFKIEQNIDFIREKFSFLEKKGYIFKILSNEDIYYFGTSNSLSIFTEPYESGVSIYIVFGEEINLTDRRYDLGKIMNSVIEGNDFIFKGKTSNEEIDLISEFFLENHNILSSEDFCKQKQDEFTNLFDYS